MCRFCDRGRIPNHVSPERLDQVLLDLTIHHPAARRDHPAERGTARPGRRTVRATPDGLTAGSSDEDRSGT